MNRVSRENLELVFKVPQAPRDVQEKTEKMVKMAKEVSLVHKELEVPQEQEGPLAKLEAMVNEERMEKMGKMVIYLCLFII